MADPKVPAAAQDAEFIKFANNLRQTATGVKFARALYTNPTQFNPKQVTQILRLMGLSIPKEMEIPLQIAQVIVSGHTIYEAYQAGNSINNASALNSMSYDNAKLAISIVTELHWLDRKQAQLLVVAADIAMLIASCGTDVRAWTSLAINFGTAGAGAQAEAKALSAKAASGWYKDNITHQAWWLQESIRKLSNNEIGLFGFLAETSFNSSMLFEQCIMKNPSLQPIRDILPTLNFLPLWHVEMNFQARTETFWGEGHRDNTFIQFTSASYGLSKEQTIAFIFDQIFKPLLKTYAEIEHNAAARKKCSIYDYSKLVALDNKDFYLENKLDIQEKFKRQFVTPADLGVDIFQGVQDKPRVGLKGFLNFTMDETPAAAVTGADRAGFIAPILKNSDARGRLDSFFNYADVPFPEDYGKDSRSLANYIAYLDLVQLVKQDPYFKNLTNNAYMNEYLFSKGSSEAWQADLKYLTMMSTVRKANSLARLNIASYLGTTPDKLVKIDENKTDQPSVFRVKG